MDTTTIISGAAVAISLLHLLVQRFYFDMKIDGRLRTIEVKTDLFWGLVEKELPRILHSPHTPEFDLLLEKMMADTLNRDEIAELEARLRVEIEFNNPDYGKRLVAILLLARVQQKLSEPKEVKK